jgi:hypothetical protein
MNGLLEASSENTIIILNACQNKEALISRKRNKQTERYLLEIWQTTFQRLQEAVVGHIELKRRIFLKRDSDGKHMEGCFEANVTLLNELDIYVEIQILGGTVVILAAHGHYTTPLPQ